MPKRRQKRLTQKQKTFVEEYVKLETQKVPHAATKAAVVAYEPKDGKGAQYANLALNSSAVQKALQNLFPVDRTEKVVEELFTMTQEERGKVKLESIKSWLDHSIPKKDASIQFNQVNVTQREKYDI